MPDEIAIEAVSSVAEAHLICAILEGEEIACYHRPTNQAAGAQDGLTSGGAREIVVRAEDAERAREVLELQRRSS